MGAGATAHASADTETLRALLTALRTLTPARDDADRIERVRLCEELKSMVAAAQVLQTREFAASQRTQQAEQGAPADQRGRGVAAQIGLARRISPWAARRYLGWANILPDELPHTFAALRAGQISEWRATLVARETIWLSREDREAVDAELAPHLEQWGDRRVEAETRRAAYRADPHGYLARTNQAVNDRRVTLRPAPETMTRLTALLPVAQGVAAYQALCQAADTTTAGGDQRGRGQIMADTLVERVAGHTPATAVPVHIELVMTDRALLGDSHPDARSTATRGDHADTDVDTYTGAVTNLVSDTDTVVDDGREEPAELIGYGPIPAALARQLALEAIGDKWIRRLYTDPTSGQLAAMDSTARFFTGNERLFVRLRDHTCRTPYCDAAIRHTDHVTPYHRGGPTAVVNAGGACEACNYVKDTAGWSTRVTGNGSILITTPTGHRYLSRQPLPPGSSPPEESPLEQHLRALLRAV